MSMPPWNPAGGTPPPEQGPPAWPNAPYQQPPPGPGYRYQPAPPPPRPQKGGGHRAGKVLPAIGAVVVAVFILNAINSGGGSGTSDTGAVSAASGPAPSCSSQLASWRSDGNADAMHVVVDELSGLEDDVAVWAGDLSDGDDTSSDRMTPTGQTNFASRSSPGEAAGAEPEAGERERALSVRVGAA